LRITVTVSLVVIGTPVKIRKELQITCHFFLSFNNYFLGIC